MAASDERVQLLEQFELYQGGPCLHCWRSGQPVVSLRSRWKTAGGSFGAKADAAGFRAVHARPMRLRERTIGALNLFREGAGRLADADALAGGHGRRGHHRHPHSMHSPSAARTAGGRRPIREPGSATIENMSRGVRT